jgi:hypothetical protein
MPDCVMVNCNALINNKNKTIPIAIGSTIRHKRKSKKEHDRKYLSAFFKKLNLML